jgi:protein arginine N-methyltransferase 5
MCGELDYRKWILFETLCGHPKELTVCPALGRFLCQWNTTRIGGVYCTDSVFDSDCGLAEEIEQIPPNVLGGIYGLYLFLEGFGRDRNLCVQALHQKLSVYMGIEYHSFIQNALQPLAKHLNSAIYEMFEEDKVKYDLYEKGIAAALAVKPDAILAVVGAGRGPIVDRALKAGAKRIFVVEKSPAAACFLRGRLADWPEGIELFEGDMRIVDLPEKIDVIVSELLGGFGDNELSPECLAGCHRFLAPGAVSVPTQYTSIIVPIMSDILWSAAAQSNRIEMCCVVRLLRSFVLSTPQECMTFTHPGDSPLYRRVRLEFHVDHPGTCHGFGGWFSCVLFGDVMLTNVPQSDSKSWYQCFFPLERPIQVERGMKIVLYFARKTNRKNVWYEWFLLEPKVTRVHNSGGRHCAFGLSYD